uniref:Large ribosomal subunit protein bL21c n=2 Tax=Roya TaxID=43942 RepID=A0A024B435_9VIRI|nr:ribosomal protein L21 [Roya anglica]YP_009256925.1 ribosomal protein L21 [Roya obtusa]AHZ11147.1 ribosomal protein L21 [Roya anglica]ANI25968.1 ribosomal protein L21 [Roya obtusa]
MTTYAIIEAGGEQLRVEPGRFYDIRLSPPKNESWENSKIVFSRVLMIRNELTTLVGNPWVENARVKGRLLHSRRDNKVLIYKMKPKKKTRRKAGHRQILTRFVVDSICVNT